MNRCFEAQPPLKTQNIQVYFNIPNGSRADMGNFMSEATAHVHPPPQFHSAYRKNPWNTIPYRKPKNFWSFSDIFIGFWEIGDFIEPIKGSLKVQLPLENSKISSVFQCTRKNPWIVFGRSTSCGKLPAVNAAETGGKYCSSLCWESGRRYIRVLEYERRQHDSA